VYTFAIVAMLGLAVWKSVGFLLGLVGKDVESSIRTFLTLGIGVLYAEILDYSAFAGWHTTFRSSWMGPVLPKPPTKKTGRLRISFTPTFTLGFLIALPYS